MVRLRWLLVSLAMAGCTTNHDSLARRPAGGEGGSSGSGGSGGSFTTGNTGNVPSGGRQNPDDEPLGADVLTLVNGVVDADAVRVCFARLSEDQQTSELVGEPLPVLAYARSAVLTELGGLDVVADAIQPWVLAGDLSLIEGLDCQESVAIARDLEAKVTPVAEPGAGGAPGAEADGGAGGVGANGAAAGEGGAGGEPEDPGPVLEQPALRARPIAALPPGSLLTGRSLLMVLSGCLGGAYYRDATQAKVCGAGYAPDEPSITPVLVKLSRGLAIGKVGLQAVQASLALGGIDVKAGGGGGSIPLTFASDVGFGSIAPRPADTRFTPAELGVGTLDKGLEAEGREGVLLRQSWLAVRNVSGIQSIADTRSYTAVLVGPDPLVIKRGWWNDATFTLIDNDPTRE
jgi:hypothetical protein